MSQVILSLEEYNKMLLRLEKLERVVTVRQGWNGEPEIAVDLRPYKSTLDAQLGALTDLSEAYMPLDIKVYPEVTLPYCFKKRVPDAKGE